MIRKDLYKIGDKIWFKAAPKWMIENAGKTGPHTVTSVTLLTKSFRSVGHTQHIQINGIDRDYAGTWFWPTKEKE